jgi:hypothetical protein
MRPAMRSVLKTEAIVELSHGCLRTAHFQVVDKLTKKWHGYGSSLLPIVRNI